MMVELNTPGITGMGVITPIGKGIKQFIDGLKSGKTNFRTMEFNHQDKLYRYPMAPVDQFDFKEMVGQLELDNDILSRAMRIRNISSSMAFGIFCALEAWSNSGINSKNTDLSRVAIVSSGSNVQQSTINTFHDKYREKLHHLNPNYGLNFFDTDLIGALSEILEISGEGFSIGAASASGNLGLIQGTRLLKFNEYDVVMVVAPLMELSIYEYQGFTNLMAMASVNTELKTYEICRPFDKRHAGFVYGQSAGCVILERNEHANRRKADTYGAITGFGVCMDSNRKPNPSMQGELKSMNNAMESARLRPDEIDYINTHGSSSKVGDITEVKAILAAELIGVKANSTKSLIGHSLTAAGLVEIIAGLIQLNENFLHKNHNLENPITDEIQWINDFHEVKKLTCFMNNSFGFGGINSSIIVNKV